MRLLVSILVFVGIGLIGNFLIALFRGQTDPDALTFALNIGYPSLALLTAYASWRRANWALGAYVTFAVVTLLVLLLVLLVAPVGFVGLLIFGPVYLGIVFWALRKGWVVLTAELRKVKRAA